MAKKCKQKTLLDKLPKNHGKRLELMIRLTERAIYSPVHGEFLVKQAERLKKELKAWKKVNH